MKKIVILGCENTHANGFLKHITEREEFSDVSVVGIYSDEEEPAKELSEKYGVKIMERHDEAVGEVDGVIITARHGDNHYKYAKPYIESGVPMFVDKPMTISEDEAVAFMSELKKHGVRLTGGSSLRQDVVIKRLKAERLEKHQGETLGGLVRAPIQMTSQYGGYYFYCHHLIEMVSEVFGRYPKSVLAEQYGKNITVAFKYPEYTVTGMYVEGSYLYYAERMAENGFFGSQVMAGEGNDWNLGEFSDFYKLLCGGEQQTPYSDFISPVFVAAAIARSMESGKEEMISYREIP